MDAASVTTLPIISLIRARSKEVNSRGARGAQSIKRPTLAQVTVSQLVSSRPASGSAVPSLLEILCPSPTLSLSNKLKTKQKTKNCVKTKSEPSPVTRHGCPQPPMSEMFTVTFIYCNTGAQSPRLLGPLCQNGKQTPGPSAAELGVWTPFVRPYLTYIASRLASV